MSRRPIAFISSTVKDLTDVREHLKERLTDAGFDVRMSEDDSFPVQPGETSHDACLHVVRTADLFVLLVGRRYGGEYPDHNKSITWREWDEAIEVGLHPIVLVDRRVNAQVRPCAKARAARRAADPSTPWSTIEDELVARYQAQFKAAPLDGDPEFGEAFGRSLPKLQRFVDELRKGHRDNWAHMEWDGSSGHAWSIVASRLGSTFAAYRTAWLRQRYSEALQVDRLRALLSLSALVADVLQRTRPTERVPSLVEGILDAGVRKSYQVLFDLSREASFSVTVHQRVGEELHPFASARTPLVRPPTRRWKVGHGHVGRTAALGRALCVPDIVQSDGWDDRDEEEPGQDRLVHRSAVSVPLGDPVRWTITCTTSRNNHFASEGTPAVLTAFTVATILRPLLLIGDADVEGHD